MMAGKTEILEKSAGTLEEARMEARIDITLPMPLDSSNEIDKYEFVTVNGNTTQIKLGEPVAVSWTVYQTLKNGRYKNVNILI